VLFPRPDLCQPGVEILELRLRAVDGQRLHALLGRSAFHKEGGVVHVRAPGELSVESLDQRTIHEGGTDVVFDGPSDRRLEDRVLDILRIVGAACSVEGVDCSAIVLCGHEDAAEADEFVIAEMIRARGWI